ncbi:response regulator [Hungatella sp.]|uniref:LytR/AlgR family response regulator transcription factor n=1 Tax=Hungatella sp. TaxID=2613924 RepID=UPI002A7FF296|nr:response regulator [Hungatella sp.]
MIHIAIVEDEAFYVQQIQNYMERYRQESRREISVTVYSDGEDILDNYKGDYDIILMDIQMRFMDGMTAAKNIRKLDDAVVIMFITNMTQYAVQGYEVDALDYIIKPVEYFAFSQKLEKAVGRIRRRKRFYVTIPVEDGIQKLDVSSIYYIEARGHQAVYKTDSGVYTARAALKD